MTPFSYPNYPTDNGYMTESIRQQYIKSAVVKHVLPENAHRMPEVISLVASTDINKPIQFWQLYSVLGHERIINLVRHFYTRVFADEAWFSSVFARIGGIEHHVNTQSAMWIDVMGGGPAYHGGEFRLNFHHTHNAIQLMNDKGAQRWIEHMVETLNDPASDMTNDPRVRLSVNTFLTYFFGKYAADFNLSISGAFGDTNPPLKRRINLLNMTSDAIEALTEQELKDALEARGIDTSKYTSKNELINKALRL